MSEDPVLDKVIEDFKARQMRRGEMLGTKCFPNGSPARIAASKGSSYALVFLFLLLAGGVFLYAFLGASDGAILIACVAGLGLLAVALLLWRGIRNERE